MIQPKYDPNTHRAFVDRRGEIKVVEIPKEVQDLWDSDAKPWERQAKAVELAWGLHFPVSQYLDVMAVDGKMAMAQMRNYGYTWIPSLMMAHVLMAPNLGGLNLPAYDAENPPVGAIIVPGV